MILEKWEWLRAKFPRKAQKLIILKARQLGALDPDTLVLTADLNWVRIKDLKTGDEVVGVDEYPPGGRGAGRKFQSATILDKWIVEKEAFRIVFDSGKEIVATGDHPFLCRKRGGTEAIWRKVSERDKFQHKSTAIGPGDEIRFVTDTWDSHLDFEDGWFSGLLDGEGSLRAKDGGGVELTVSQVDGPVLRRAAEYLRDNGYPAHVEVDKRKKGEKSKLGDQPVYKLVINQMPEIFRIIGRLQPSRFAGRRPWDGKKLPKNEGWAKVISVEKIGVRKMVDVRTSTGTFIAEGFVTHNCSTLIEGLIAWSTIFFANRNAMVVSHNDAHAAYLFRILLHIFDMLPWWLKPMVASRKQEDGLIFMNPDPDARRDRPGNQSQVSVQSASQVSGVGEGMTLHAVHASEYASWNHDRFKEIIDGDMVHAIADLHNSFAFLESTGKGAGTPAEEMWQGQVELAEEAEWLPVFLPWFFEKTRVEILPQVWSPEKPEVDMRERVKREWTRCSSPECEQYFESIFRMVSRVNAKCPECGTGALLPVVLTDEQLRFMQIKRKNAEKKGLDSVKHLKEELATTAEEAWQISGIQVFPPSCHEFVNACTDPNPMIWGDIDSKGNVHYVANPHTGQCGIDWCQQDHQWDSEHPLQIWELPDPSATYSIGVDVAEGMSGKGDYSVIWINKVSPNGRNPDEQVAMWRSNTVDPIQLASPINWLGRMYNEALVSIEVNVYDSCFNTVRMQYLYPNLFVWKHYDSKNPMSNKLGWVTNLRSKPMLWQTAVRWLKARQWIIRSDIFAHEMKRFQKDDYDDQRAQAERNFHDDTLIAGMIALFCAHDLDYSEEAGGIPVKSGNLSAVSAWDNRCTRCGHDWQTDEFPPKKCIKCRAMTIQSHRKTNEGNLGGFDFSQLGKSREQMLEDGEDPSEIDRQFGDQLANY